MSQPLPFATPAYALRAVQKDAHYRGILLDHLVYLATLVFGTRFANLRSTEIAAVSDAVYHTATFVAGRQTLGEEFTDLLPVTSSRRVVGSWHRIVFVIVDILVPILLKEFSLRAFPEQNSAQIVSLLKQVHQSWFFIAGGYADIARRLTWLKWLSMTPALAGRGPGGDPTRARFMWIGAMNLVVQIAALIKIVRPARRSVTSPRALAAGLDGRERDPEGEPDEAVVGKCPLCLDVRRCPTATACGHVFCWECIAECCRQSGASSDPTAQCPMCRQAIAATGLVRLANFQTRAATSPTARSPRRASAAASEPR